MDQDVPADHEIEAYGVDEGINRSLGEDDMQDSVRLSPLSRNSEDLRIGIDADDRAGRANQLAGQHRDVAGATTQIENPHAALDARAPQQALGGRLDVPLA